MKEMMKTLTALLLVSVLAFGMAVAARADVMAPMELTKLTELTDQP